MEASNIGKFCIAHDNNNYYSEQKFNVSVPSQKKEINIQVQEVKRAY